MKKTKIKLIILYVIGIGTLIAGLIVYLFFREPSHISEIIDSLLPITFLGNSNGFAEYQLLKYWLPDFLWAVSFSAWLHIALSPGLKGSVFCFVTVSLTGIVFEIFQNIDVISGTADVLDIIAYISASALMSIIYLFLKEKNK